MVEDRLSPVESLKLAAKHFPALFGVSFDLGLGGEHGKAFLALAEIRKEITHPETLEHLGAIDMYRYWIPGFTWVLSRLGELLILCAQQIEGLENFDKSLGDIPPYKHEGRTQVFSLKDYQIIRASSLKSLEYIQPALDVLMRDTSRAMGLASSLARTDTLLGPQGQFGLRNWVRTFFSEVEGTIGILSFFILASTEREEFYLSGVDRESLDGKLELDEQIVRLMNLWSRKFGDRRQTRLGGSKLSAFRRALKCRDRITHPKSPKDLRIAVDEMGAIVAADTWFREVDLAYFDAENWGSTAR